MTFVPVDILDDRTEETAIVGGLGNYILQGSAVPGQQTFASVMTVGQTTWVFCYDPISFVWEVDRATYATGNQLQRTAVLASSSGGAKVNFPGNTCQIGMTIPAAFVLQMLSQTPSGSPYSFGTLTWVAPGVVVAQNGTYTVTGDQDVNAHLLSVEYSNGPGGGTVDVGVFVNGTTLTGFGAIAVNSTGAVAGSGEVAAGSVVKLVVTNVSGTVDGYITLSGTQD